MLTFTEAVREQVLLRMAIVGANGSGKTLGALRTAEALGGPVAVIDTEHGRAKLYADRFKFSHADLRDHKPEAFRDAARQAAELVGVGGTVVIDSLSHEWLDVLTEADKFGDWKTLTPRHREFLEAIISIPANLIVTMRAKVKYQVSEVDVPGRDKPRQVIERVGVGPVQREGVEYEFDVLAYLDTDHEAHFANRCEPLVDRVLPIDDEAIGIIVKWLAEGDPPTPVVFDPETELLPGAIKGRDAGKKVREALERMAPGVDWDETLQLLSVAVYGQDKPPAPERTDFLRRFSNAAAKLSESLTGDFPPPTTADIAEAFAFAFSGHVLDVIEHADHDPNVDASSPAEDADRSPATDGDIEHERGKDEENEEMALADLDAEALEAAAADTAFG